MTPYTSSNEEIRKSEDLTEVGPAPSLPSYSLIRILSNNPRGVDKRYKRESHSPYFHLR